MRVYKYVKSFNICASLVDDNIYEFGFVNANSVGKYVVAVVVFIKYKLLI
jgi:hypothetical protein